MPLGNEAEVLVYLQPLPQEAGKLRFTIGGISAVGSDGSEIALALAIKELKGADLVGHQKLLATGIVPPGPYTGLSILIEKAFIQGEEGETALFIPAEPVRARLLFEAKRRQASALFLSLNASGAIADGISFTPTFSLAAPSRPLINFTGYVSNSAWNLISVFNKKTMQVINTIATGRGPRGVVLDQRRARAYVAVSEDDRVEVYDVFAGTLIDSIRLSFGDYPMELALTPDGRTLVSVNRNSNTVSLIDSSSLFEVTKISVGEGPTSAVVDPSGFKAYIFNSLSNTISVVDLTQRAISVTIGVAGSPLRGAFNLRGDRLFVISRNSPNLQVIDPLQLRVVEKIFVGPGASSIKVDFRTGLILVGKKSGGEIILVDPSSLMFIDTIQVKGNAIFMTIDRQENTLFVVLPERKLVQKINLTSKEILAEIEVGEGAYAVAVVGES
jgi:YVTN family beta-propeller protein